MTDADPQTTLSQAEAALGAGDPQDAFATVRALIEHPAAALAETADFVAAFSVFARIAAAIAGPELGQVMARVVATPDDPRALYDAGYALYEQQLHAIAATTLARADRLRPGDPEIVAELSSAFEGMMAYGEAAEAVERSGLAEHHPWLAYLSGFNRMMIGDLAAARRRLTQLERVAADVPDDLLGTLAGMVHRAEALVGVGIDLGSHALTAWHAIIDASVLLHESPHGYDGPMRGRYAYVADSPALMAEGLARLATVLRVADRMPARVIAAPDRASTILAHAAARVLELPLVPWSTAGESGLVVVWNLDAVGDASVLGALKDHADDRILFAHASDWVDPFPYAPDVTTFLGQTITHPYMGEGMRVDPETDEVVTDEPDTRDVEVLAQEIVASASEGDSRSSIDLIATIVRALARLPASDRLGLARTAGPRTRQRAGSPVASARFA